MKFHMIGENLRKDVVHIVLAGVSGHFIASYLHFRFEYLVALLVLCIILFCIRTNEKQKFNSKVSVIFIGIFSSLLSFAIILGDHIHTQDTYYGTIMENYIIPYTLVDVVAFFFIAFGIFEMAKSIYFWHANNKKLKKYQFCIENKISYKVVIIVAVCLFFAWLPYLLVYFPGYIFGDTMSSIAQALGNEPLNNHHPVCYTLFIKLCFKIGRIFGGNTVGCVLYCVIQMVYMSLSISYLICWLFFRMNLRKIHLIALGGFYGVIPYFAQMSIAMWKDPIFGVTLVVITLMIMEAILSRGAVIQKDKFFGIKYVFLLLVLIFVRNNGIYIAFFMSVVFIIMSIYMRKDLICNALKKMAIFTILVALTAQFITGPLYDKLGIEKEKVESYGIFLNQMARVVACEGKMSEEDREYMEQLLPLELYKSVYTPCCVDSLKWNSNFDSSVLEENFFKRYFSMFKKNPRIFFEAWELQTYGFWTINCDEVNYYSRNIVGGVPRNYYLEYKDVLEEYDIKVGKYVNSELLTKVFPIEDIGIPIGIINWCVVLLVIFLILRKQELLVIALTPTIGLMITLIVASPIHYWPRYAVAEQYLIPFYIALFVCSKNQEFSRRKE